jgi:hypothetical protein
MAERANAVRTVALQQEDYNDLLKAERALHDYLPEFDKAEECGIECQYLRESAKDMLERIAKFKLYYKPKV